MNIVTALSLSRADPTHPCLTPDMFKILLLMYKDLKKKGARFFQASALLVLNRHFTSCGEKKY